MKKYGEITAIHNRTATVRLYKIKKNKDAVSTAKTLSASVNKDVNVGDMVEVEVNRLLLFFSTICGYLFPVITGVSVHGIAAMLTDNLIIMQSLFMITVLLTYAFASHISKKPFFKNLTVCSVINIAEFEK